MFLSYILLDAFSTFVYATFMLCVQHHTFKEAIKQINEQYNDVEVEVTKNESIVRYSDMHILETHSKSQSVLSVNETDGASLHSNKST